MPYSTCCGAETDFTEIDICPECLEHCDFEDEEDETPQDELEQEELAKMFDFRLAKQVDRIIFLLNIDSEIIIFTVFNKKNILAESFIEQVYKTGKIESRFFTDYDLALIKLEKYEG